MTAAAATTFQPPTAARDAYRRLVEHVKNNCRPSDRLPPIRELARNLRVGVGSANLAVKQLAREGVLVSRPRLGTFVADMPQPPASATSRIAGKRVSIVNAINTDGMVALMARTVERELAAHGVHVDHVELDMRKFHDAERPDADAIVVINPNSKPDITVAPDQQLLILQTAAESPAAPGTRYDEVTVDQTDAVTLAGQYLREVGCASACFLGVHHDDPPNPLGLTAVVRLAAFERGWGEPIPQHLRFSRKSYGESWGARMVADYLSLDERPDAVFAASDELAVGFVKGALALGLEPGRDYSIVGFDGQQRGRDLLEGPLTTIEAPAELMAERGAELLADRLAHPDQPTRRLQLGCTLFKGNTVRRKTT